MARKVDRNRKPVSAPPQGGADDLAVMHPDVEFTLPDSGRKLLLREYGFTEGLRVRAFMAPFTADLANLFEAPGSEVLVEDVLDLVGAHLDAVHRAIAQSIAPEGASATEQDVAWVAQLSDKDGDLLINYWWGVCGLFFVRQVVRRKAERVRRKVLEKGMFAGAMSTQNSSHPASAPQSASIATPPASSSSSTTGSSPAETGNGPT